MRFTGILLASILLEFSPCALALNPALDVSQYAHTAWKVRDGFTKGIINSVAQTPDGYLWLGTDFGLVRFDGVRTVPWTLPGGERSAENVRKAAIPQPYSRPARPLKRRTAQPPPAVRRWRELASLDRYGTQLGE